jgi:hypothetical protein
LIDLNVPIIIEDNDNIGRKDEPVRLGVPIPKAKLFDIEKIQLVSSDGKSLQCQCQPLSYWNDQSIKWILLDFIIDLEVGQRTTLFLRRIEKTYRPSSTIQEKIIKIDESKDIITVDTGTLQFAIFKRQFAKFESILVNKKNLVMGGGFNLTMTDRQGKEHVPNMNYIVVDHKQGGLRSLVLIEGEISTLPDKKMIQVRAYLHFFAGSGLVKVDIWIRNQHAALHPKGMWDLGDPGSIFFQDLSLSIMPSSEIFCLECCTGSDNIKDSDKQLNWTIYQDSSGGDNWNSTNHINHLGKASRSFQGFRLYKHKQHNQSNNYQLVEEGKRALPYMKLCTKSGWLCGTIENFWQNFPKSLQFKDGKLRFGLFPMEDRGGFELQGGEQKRHSIYLDFGEADKPMSILQIQRPIHVYVAPEWIEKSKAIPFFAAGPEVDDLKYTEYVAQAIEGEHSFFNKREVIDEYGWRNFGDIYADHEAVKHTGENGFISHFNNQYDFNCGAFLHFLRTGDRRWRDLAIDGVMHAMDIDIYHTDKDKAAYNHGMFWHTEHYTDAQTCTHRTYSRKNIDNGCCGGGPSNEHIYTSSLLLYYYLTGDRLAGETLIEIARWVMKMDDGAETVYGLIDSGPTGKASQTGSEFFHKPGRGAGNAVNALIDAYEYSNNRNYMQKAEELIQRCIHPKDSLLELRLDEPENRWSYLVFLQILGKYLELKIGLGEIDYHFHYARESLLHYTEWMATNEVPYNDVMDRVELPTETWPAQDIRKCHIFHLAEWFCQPKEQERYRERADFFFERCLTDLLKFDTSFCTRPMVILLAFGFYRLFFKKYQPDKSLSVRHSYDFGYPKEFAPQKARLTTTLKIKKKVLIQFIRQALVTKIHDMNLKIKER